MEPTPLAASMSALMNLMQFVVIALLLVCVAARSAVMQLAKARPHQRRSAAERGRRRSFCLARNDPQGQGKKIGDNLCGRDDRCDQHDMQLRHREKCGGREGTCLQSRGRYRAGLGSIRNSPELRHSPDVKVESPRNTAAPIVFAEALEIRLSARGDQSVERKAGSSRDTATIQSPEMTARLVGSVNPCDMTLGQGSPRSTDSAHCLALATVATCLCSAQPIRH
jgi:hypothetical protein